MAILFRNGAKSALLSPRVTGNASHMKTVREHKVGSSNASAGVLAVVFPRARPPEELSVDHALASNLSVFSPLVHLDCGRSLAQVYL